MVDTRSCGVSLWLVSVIFVCGVHHSATKGQRVRSSPDIPVTQFSCADRPPGYYADVETGCQVYHMCTEGGNQFSYKCPNTTLFQQRMFICAHWYQVNCSRSEQHFAANLLIGQRDKPFVNDDPSHGKQVKTLQNPDTLQHLSQSARKGSDRQAKSQSSNENVQSNKVLPNKFKQNGFQPSTGFTRTTPSGFHNSFSTTDSSNRRVTEDLSSLPLAGSVLPGGIRSFQQAQSSNNGFTSISQTLPSTFPPRLSSTIRPQFKFTASQPIQRVNQPIQFNPTSTSKSIGRINLFATTSAPSSFRTNSFPDSSSSFQPGGFTKPPQILPGNIFQQESYAVEPALEFQPPSDQQQSLDLAVASQENAVSSRRSTTTTTTTTTTTQPSFEVGEISLPETDVKAVIEQTQNGSLPEDRYNTFLRRFNPYEEAPSKEVKDESDKQEQEHHVFINRFVPDFGPSAIENNFKENPDNYVFINRFVLTPEEVKREKNRQKVDKLHNLLPPDDHVTVDFPGFDLTPPLDDSENSESNTIELHLQDPRRTLFIPDEVEDEFSKADAAPIVVSIPLHSHQKSPPMWFKNIESDDPCSRCHPSFIVNKDTCMPCVIIR